MPPAVPNPSSEVSAGGLPVEVAEDHRGDGRQEVQDRLARVVLRDELAVEEREEVRGRVGRRVERERDDLRHGTESTHGVARD